MVLHFHDGEASFRERDFPMFLTKDLFEDSECESSQTEVVKGAGS